MRLLECVPNISEGNDLKKIEYIVTAVKEVKNVYVLDVDPGKSTNRTVITFAGEPEAVIEAAFLLIQRAAEVIDMRSHQGAHPRMGATDVCPLIPIQGISIEETIQLAHKLARRVGEELKIPVYLYEYAATKPERKNLASIRAGEYEALPDKLKRPEWKPDYGPALFNPNAGATVIGVRDFLLAYNINLNTQSVKRANSVAFDLREKGRVKRDENGKILRDEHGKALRIPGALKGVKAIGWYIEEYGIAQVSMNITNLQATPLHIAFEEAEKSAFRRGLRVTGSEIVGMVPKQSLIDAGKYFLKKQNRSRGLAEEELIFIAIKTLGLNELAPFNTQEKIIEYKLQQLQQNEGKILIQYTVKDFINEVARESMAPGGGSVAATLAALGAALGTMVANLSANKKGWQNKIDQLSSIAEVLQTIKQKLFSLVDEDTHAFYQIINAHRIKAKTETEKQKKQQQIENAVQRAVSVPLQVMKMCIEIFPWLEKIASIGNPNSISDVGVGTWSTWAAFQSALLNVKINLNDVTDKNFYENVQTEVQALQKQAEQHHKKILNLVEKVLNSLKQ